jgi:hypothetical protein
VNAPLSVYLPYLALTLGIELPVVVLLLRRRCGAWRSLAAGTLASGVTHPLLWYVWPLVVSPYRYVLYVTTGEALVMVIETVVLHEVAVRRVDSMTRIRRWGLALAVATAANATSLGTGLLIHALR